MTTDLEKPSTSYTPPRKNTVTGKGVGRSKLHYRDVWDRITLETCRWHQSVSKDGGQSWEWNWWVEWTRHGSSGAFCNGNG